MGVAYSGRHAALVESVLNGSLPASASGIDPHIVASWKRCFDDYGLSPAERFTPLQIAEDERLSALKANVGDLLDIVRVEIDNLHAQIADSGYGIVFTNKDGVVLERRCRPDLVNLFGDAGFRVGVDWSESAGGTNGIGTCLSEKSPVIVHLQDHFLSHHTALTCSGAPILDPYGELLGVLDASAANSRDTRLGQKHTMALVSMSANLISNCYFLRHFRDAWVLRFHSRSEFVGLLIESMLAVDESGCVLGATESAVEQLGLQSREDLKGKDIGEVFSVSTARVLERAKNQSHVSWPVHQVGTGRRFFVISRRPERKTGLQRIVKPGSAVRVPSQRAVSPHETLEDLSVGDPRMAYNVRCAERVMDKSVPILLCGETGTGKEVLARAIHNASGRSGKPFVAVNCAAIPESLIESELFGYKHGAFTGARREGMPGQILLANGGTLFLDEIGDMPHQLQSRLLRVLEESVVVPLGGGQPVSVDLNVICATHQDLVRLVAEKSFREDLYYRLNGIMLQLPPLREREDKDGIIHRALSLENDTGAEVSIDAEAFERLMMFNWPGNMRQLRHVVRTALALSDDGVVRLSDLPTEIVNAGLAPGSESCLTQFSQPESIESHAQSGADRGSLQNRLASEESNVILKELERNRWNVTNTAARLQMSRNTLYRKMKKYGFSPSAS